MSAAHDPALERSALALLRELVDLDACDRTTRLDDVERDTPELAARVRALLARVVDDAVADESVDALPADTRIGPYRLVARIGRGGMGEVFRARRDDGAFDRDVALKRIWGGFAPLTERFLRERQVLARLQHPGIAQLYDGGIDANGAPWFAMELVDGEPITHWCDARRATLEQRVDLLRQVAEAVDVAHRALIVHRDLKPANVLVDAAGAAKLLDFGIAKLLDDADPNATQTLAMTPAWASPEQRDGRPITTAADVWQLGTLLRVLLVGELPDVARPPMRLAATIDAMLRADPARAAAVAAARSLAPDQLRTRLRGDLDSIVAQATADVPDERYRSAAAFAEELQRWQAGLPVQARRDERGYRMRRMLRRRWPALAAGVAVLTAAIGFGAFHIQRLDAELARAEYERAKAQSVADLMLDVFRSATPEEIDDPAFSARKLLERSATKLRADNTQPPGVRAALLTSAGRVYLDLGRMEDAEKTLGEGVRLMRADARTPPEALALALRSWAQALYGVDRIEQSLAATREGIAAIERSPRRGGEEHAGMLNNAAIALAALSRYEQARALERQSLEILRRRGPASRRAYVNALTNAANIESFAGRPDRAGDMLRIAVEQSAQLRPFDADQHAKSLYSYATLLRTVGDYPRAEANINAALDVMNRYHGVQHPDYPNVEHEFGLILMAQGRLADAAARIDASLVRTASLYPDAHPLVQQKLWAAALIAALTGNATRARTLVDRLEPADPRSLGIDHAVQCMADTDSSSGAAHLRELERNLRETRDVIAEDAWLIGVARGLCQRALAARRPVS